MSLFPKDQESFLGYTVGKHLHSIRDIKILTSIFINVRISFKNFGMDFVFNL